MPNGIVTRTIDPRTWLCGQRHEGSDLKYLLLIRLTRQETSPFGPCLTLRLHWQLVIRHSSGHAISLSCLTAGLSGKVMTLVACVFIWGSSWLSCIPNPTISVFFYNNREGPLQALLKPSLSILDIMASGDTCPQGNSNPCRRLERAVS